MAIVDSGDQAPSSPEAEIPRARSLSDPLHPGTLTDVVVDVVSPLDAALLEQTASHWYFTTGLGLANVTDTGRAVVLAGALITVSSGRIPAVNVIVATAEVFRLVVLVEDTSTRYTRFSTSPADSGTWTCPVAPAAIGAAFPCHTVALVRSSFTVNVGLRHCVSSKHVAPAGNPTLARSSGVSESDIPESCQLPPAFKAKAASVGVVPGY